MLPCFACAKPPSTATRPTTTTATPRTTAAAATRRMRPERARCFMWMPHRTHDHQKQPWQEHHDEAFRPRSGWSGFEAVIAIVAIQPSPPTIAHPAPTNQAALRHHQPTSSQRLNPGSTAHGHVSVGRHS